MGRLLIVALVIITVIVLWKAFGPKTWNNNPRVSQKNQFPQLGRQKNKDITAKGPDDDPDFLWNIKKERFKAQREAEKREQEAVERSRRGEHWDSGEKDAGKKDAGATGASDQTKDANPGKGENNGGTQEKKDGEGGA